MANDPLNLQPIPGLAVPGLYYHGHGHAATDAYFKNDGARAVLTIIVAGDMDVAAIKSLLGYPKDDGANLQRQLPLAHPVYDWLYCTEISGIKQGGSPISLGDDGDTPICAYAWITAVYTSPVYDLLADGGPEYMRYCTLRIQPYIQTLALTNGVYLKYTDPATPVAYKSVVAQGSFNVLVPRAKVILRWWMVPGTYCCDANGFPTKILALAGRVNSVIFLGRNPGELLMMSPNTEPVTAPVKPGDIGAPAGATVSRLYNVDVYMEYLSVPVVGAIYGHLTTPLPGDPQGRWAGTSATFSPPDVGAPLVQPLYQSLPFSTAFDHV